MKKLSKFLLSFLLIISISQPIVASATDVNNDEENTEEQQENENNEENNNEENTDNEEADNEETEVDEETGEGTPVDEENGTPLIQDGNEVIEDENADVRQQPIETPASVTGERYQGSGTVVDFTTNGSRYVYTVQTPDDSVFYLMIDMDMTENNVFFLSEVNQEELSINDVSSNQQVQEPVEQEPVNTEEVETNEAQEVEEAEEEGSNVIFWILLILITVGILGYHLFFGKIKHLNPFLDDEDKEVKTKEFDKDVDVHHDNQEGLVADDDDEETEDDEK